MGRGMAVNQMKAQISFDLVMIDEMSFVEGTYRLPGHDWQVLIVSRYPIAEPKINVNATWQGGITGCAIHFPEAQTLNKRIVLQLLSEAFGVAEWEEVRGPDSMKLR
jgi:hypothetical protein